VATVSPQANFQRGKQKLHLARRLVILGSSYPRNPKVSLNAVDRADIEKQ
jgi:hypothetical protein